MPYKISYGITAEKKAVGVRKQFGISMVGVLLVALAVLARLFYPSETRQLTEALFPLTSELSQQALKTFSQNIKEGESFSDAVTAFCREIVDETVAS